MLLQSPNLKNSNTSPLKNSRRTQLAGLIGQISPPEINNLFEVDSSKSINAQITLDSRPPIIVSHKKLNQELSKNLSCHSIKQAIILDGIEKMESHVKKLNSNKIVMQESSLLNNIKPTVNRDVIDMFLNEIKLKEYLETSKGEFYEMKIHNLTGGKQDDLETIHNIKGLVIKQIDPYDDEACSSLQKSKALVRAKDGP